MICMTARFALNQLDAAEIAYADAFGTTAPVHIHGCQYGGVHERTRLLQRATRCGVPLRESDLGQKLLQVEGEYARLLGGTPREGFLWHQDGEESLAERIAIVEECLRLSKRRLMIEYGDGEDFPEKDAVSRFCLGDRMKLWLDRDGKVLWFE